MAMLCVNTDGGARGNPGPAAIGVVFRDEAHNILFEYREKIGNTTNNQAEYRAVIKALEIITKSDWDQKNNHDSRIIFNVDSKLVVEQINGNYKVKNDDIKNFMAEINKLIRAINKEIIFVHVPREQNKEADKLVNMALDS